MGITLAVGIFIICYFFIILGKVNQALVAMTGATMLMVAHIYTWDEAFKIYIDWDTIALLFSMMVIVGITEKTGLFQYIAIKFAQLVKGQPKLVFIGTSLITAICSALLDNVTTVLLFVPVILSVTKLLKLPSFPFLTMIIFSANIGGAATLIGDPPNLMIGQAIEHFTFMSFIIHLGPIVLFLLVVLNCLMLVIFGKQLKTKEYLVKQLFKLNPADYLTNKKILPSAICVFILTMLGFLLHSIIHIDLITVSISGALLLLLLTEKEIETTKVFERVEWDTLFFFIGLYILVGGLKEVGVLSFISEKLIYLTKGNIVSTSIGILWFSGLFTQFVNNVPFVAAMIPVIKEFHSYGIEYLDPLWWALALGSCLGGNGTLVGSSANVVVAGLAEANGHPLPFIRFLKFGVPLVIVTLIFSTIYLFFRHLIPFL
ncbi:ArsB/NhaD family transporter [Amphibacillus sediminis]|uniref:ArsB/NhaD family transporter n=1 Tax=Amphibacillus sediminis TaxID=360185 RepID=UPI0008338593|nr:ArsB/NhaD family transporter [Amphibacillus sediminis]